MNFDKAIDREGHERGTPLTQEELADRQGVIEGVRAGVDYSAIGRFDLLAAFMDALDMNRIEWRRLHEAVHIEKNGSGYRLLVPEDQARQILAEVLNKRRTDPPNE